MRKTALFLSAALFVLSILSPVTTAYAYEPDFSVQAKAVYLINLDEDKVLYEKNANERVYPASLTKIMTAILTYEHIEDLDNTIIPMKAYIEDYLYRVNREAGGGLSLSGLLRNEELSARKLLYAIMLPSGNEAAMMLGDYIGDGSLDYFTQLMNEKAKEIGALNTNFVNTNGLHDENHYTTAYDMYLITRYAMEIPGFMEVASTTYFNGGPTNKHERLDWNTTNKMMVAGSEFYLPYVKGVKTGSTPEAGRCLISTASKDGYNYLCVVMGAPYNDAEGKAYTSNQAFAETKKIYEWAFSSFRTKTLIEKGEGVGEVKLRLGKDGKDHLLLMSGERYTSLLPVEIEATSVTYELDVPKTISAPIERGQEVGSIRLMLAGEEVGRVPLVAAEKAAANPISLAFDKAMGLFRPFWMKFILLFAALLLVAYLALTVLRNRNKQRYQNRSRHRKL